MAIKTTIITMILACQYILSPQFSTQWRMDNPQLVKEADAIVETAENETTSEWEWAYYEPLKPVYEDERAVSVHCEDWELEELARLAYLEAGADWMSDEVIRAVIEVVFRAFARA